MEHFLKKITPLSIKFCESTIVHLTTLHCFLTKINKKQIFSLSYYFQLTWERLIQIQLSLKITFFTNFKWIIIL